MSTHDLNVDLTRPRGANRSVESVERTQRGLETYFTQKLEAGNRDDQSVTGVSTENPQTTKNLHIRRKILVKCKSDWASTVEDQRKTPDQLRFTSILSVQFPSKRIEKNSTDSDAETYLSGYELHTTSKAIKRPADAQHPELCEKVLPPNNFRQLAGKVIEDGHVSELHIEEEGTHSQPKNFAQVASSHGSTAGLQCSVVVSDQAQTAKTPEKELGVNDPLGENVEGARSQSNLIPFGEESSSKANTSCQSCAGSPRELKRALSVPSFPAPLHTYKLETEPNLIGPSAPMFTSTIVSVLAPNWNGRLRRHKRGVGEVGQDIQESGDNGDLTAPRRNARRQTFLFTQMKPGGQMLDELNSKLREPAGARRSSVEWQRETRPSHLTANIQTKRPLLKPSHPNQQTADHNNKFGTNILAPLDSHQVPGSPISPQPGGYRKRFHCGDKGESFSPPTSRPTTSSLLLSWRRLNSGKANAEAAEMEKRLAETIDSLSLLSKSRLSVSQPQSPLVSPDNPTKESFMPYTFRASPERHRPVKSPDSPGNRVIVTSKKSMFLSKREFDISSRTSWDTSKEGQDISSPTGPGQSETPHAPQCSKKAAERKCSHTGNNVSVEPSITDYTNVYNTNVNSLHRTSNFPSTCISHKDNTNNNIGNLISHHYHISDTVTEKDVSYSTEMSQNISACVPPDSIYDVMNSNKVNTENTSKSTMVFSSHTSPKTIHTHAGGPSAVLTSMPISQSTQSSILNTCNLNSENLSPSPTHTMSRTFTDSLAFSPRKTEDDSSPSHVWLNYVNSRHSQSNQSPSNLTSPLSQSRPLRRVCAPSIYSYLRETSPTVTSSEHTSPSPQPPFLNQDRNQIQKENKNPETLRFTFDLSPVESQDLLLSKNSYTPSAPQSLPPDFSKRSGNHFSKSPYSTLISARPALNSALQNFSSPPVSCQHTKSASYHNSTMSSSPLKPEKDSSHSMPNDRLIQGESGEPSCSSKMKLNFEQTSFATLETSVMSRSSLDARFKDGQTTNVIPNTTHPKQRTIKNMSDEEPVSMFSLHSDKVNTYQGPSPSGTLSVSETVPAVVQDGVKAMQIHDTKGTQRTNSKINIFSRKKKDNNLTSAASAGKEGLTHQDIKKEVLMGLSKMDQVLNRLKLKLGVKSSDDDFISRRKTKNFSQQSLDSKDSESNRGKNESQTLKLSISSKYQRESPSLGFKFEAKANEDEQRRLADENGNQFLGRPQNHNWPKPHYINRYATLPQTRKNALGPSPALHSEFALKDVNYDDVFYSPTKQKNLSIYKTENVSPTANSMFSQKQRLMGAHLSASCADLKYGLERGRSVSVSSIVSGRPSGPGRISTGSKRGSVNDLTSSDEFGTRNRHSSISSPGESPECDASSLPGYKGCVRPESSPYQWDTEPSPTPPPSPPFSPLSRRMSPRPSSSSAGSRASQDSLSPCGFLPSRNYISTLSVFEESSSDTTTDDEYYLNSDNEKETEL